VITFASTPKPFIGHIGVIQQNAIGSWLQMDPKPEVYLFGNEEGVADIAKEFGVHHVPDIACNEFGTPMLDSVFSQFEELADTDVLCYSNCDIILFQDLLPVIEHVHSTFPQFLFVAECQNMDKKVLIDYMDPNWEQELRREMAERGTRRVKASDFFLFTKGMYEKYPPLILGRAYFDNWIIYEARRLSIPVVNGTGSVSAIHQNHFYSAVPGETAESHSGSEARMNLEIIGSRDRVYWMYDNTHRYRNGKICADLFGRLLVRERAQMLKRRIRKCCMVCARPFKPMLKKLGLL